MKIKQPLLKMKLQTLIILTYIHFNTIIDHDNIDTVANMFNALIGCAPQNILKKNKGKSGNKQPYIPWLTAKS